MKKVKILGNSIPVLVLVLLGIGLVSGALMGYISNQVKADVTVESPMEQLISNGGDYGLGPITLTTLQGGESITLWVKTHNKADVAITGKVVNTVTSWDGVTCADFKSVNVRTSKDGGTTWDPVTGYYDLIAYNLCTDDGDGYHITFNYGPSPTITWIVGQTDINEIKVTFKTNALGTYTFASQVVPV